MSATLEAVGISKWFGAFKALCDVDATFNSGEIHAVLGENGAGKSTLMRILAGELRPDAGQIRLSVECSRIGIVHQHFMLVPAFTVSENFALGSTAKGALCNPLVDAQPALLWGETLGWPIDPNARTGDIPVGAQQRIEILKALATDADILIFDEPTAVLSPVEVEDLFRVLRMLRDQGKTVILIAHKLSEVLAIADQVTVLRHGIVVGTAMRSEVDSELLAKWMIGGSIATAALSDSNIGEVVVHAKQVRVTGDRGEPSIRGVDFEIRSGEIVGFGGVDGNGQIELAESLAGIRKLDGSITKPIHVAYIPQDRHRDGLALSMSVLDNMAIAGVDDPRFSKFGFLNLAALRDWATSLMIRFDIRGESIDQKVRFLSGGNQQKIVVGRNLDQRPEFVIAVNPTRGLDISATNDVHRRLQEIAAEGAAIALFSTDLDELAELANHTFFLSRGKFVESGGSAAVVGGLD